MRNPLRIIHSIPGLSIGGIERLVSHICRSLARRGHTVKLIAFSHGGEMQDEAAPAMTEIWGIKPRQVFRLAGRTAQSLQDFNADILHAHPGLGARLGAFRAHVPVVSTYHTLHAHRSLPLRWLDGYLAKRTAAITAISETVKELWKTRIGHRDILVIPNGIDLAIYENLPSREECCQILGWKGANIVCVARLHRDKGVDVLLNAWARLTAKAGWMLRIVGSGTEEGNLKNLATSLGIQDSVDFVGGMTNIAKYWKAATIAIVPSRIDGFGLTVIEAMAAGTPVIVSDAGALKQLAEGFGAVFESENIVQLVELMEKLMNHRNEREEMTKKGLIRAKQYDLEKTVDRLEELYYQVLDMDRQTNSC